MKAEFVFLGKVRWFYRLKDILFALKVLWKAIQGYGLSIMSNDDIK